MFSAISLPTLSSISQCVVPSRTVNPATLVLPIQIPVTALPDGQESIATYVRPIKHVWDSNQSTRMRRMEEGRKREGI